jgi:hypothetical protein
MSVTLRLEGQAELLEALRKMGIEAQAEARKAVQATALEVRGQIVKGYQKGPASGVTRDLSSPRRTHTASAPGEAPATDTGRLASGTDYRMTGDMSAEVGNSVTYGPYLEFGTQRIAPRPLWRPTVIAAQPKFRARLETALARVMR